jgi:AcrR family transcriptional regulator
MTSTLRNALEQIIATPAPRNDTLARDRRVMASVLVECAEHGCTNAKMTKIATRARVSTATLYRDYGDRDTLFAKSLELALTLRSTVWRPKALPSDPLERLEHLARSHARGWQDPFIGWLIRMYIQFSSLNAPYLLTLGRAAHASNLAYWQEQIEGLEREGYLVKGHTSTIIDLMLGPIERRTILARLGFGEDDDHVPKIEDVTPHLAYAIFKIFGTDAFWASRVDDRAPGWCGDGRDAFEMAPRPASGDALFYFVDQPQALLDLPSTRLAAYAERVLAQDSSRLDTEGRKRRIQLATMLECIDHGYENVGMAEIATRAKVSTATLYSDYADKRSLFIDTMKMQARLRIDYDRMIDPDARFQDNIASLVFSIARVLADPKFVWFHYVSMASDLSQEHQIMTISRETRHHTEGYWITFIEGLSEHGRLPLMNTPLLINLLLGPTQRKSVQSLVLFGIGDSDDATLARLARHSTEFFLRLAGPVSPASPVL